MAKVSVLTIVAVAVAVAVVLALLWRRREAFSQSDADAIALRVDAMRSREPVDADATTAEEHVIDIVSGTMALDLMSKQPRVFAALLKQFDSPNAYDLVALQKAVAPFCSTVSDGTAPAAAAGTAPATSPSTVAAS